MNEVLSYHKRDTSPLPFLNEGMIFLFTRDSITLKDQTLLSFVYKKPFTIPLLPFPFLILSSSLLHCTSSLEPVYLQHSCLWSPDYFNLSDSFTSYSFLFFEVSQAYRYLPTVAWPLTQLFVNSAVRLQFWANLLAALLLWTPDYFNFRVAFYQLFLYIFTTYKHTGTYRLLPGYLFNCCHFFISSSAC